MSPLSSISLASVPFPPLFFRLCMYGLLSEVSGNLRVRATQEELKGLGNSKVLPLVVAPHLQNSGVCTAHPALSA